jgi:hypothetical protein
MYPNGSQPPPFDFQKPSDDQYPKREGEGVPYPPPTRFPPGYPYPLAYPGMLPPRYDLEPQYAYPGYPPMQLPRHVAPSYPLPVSGFNTADPMNVDLLRGIAMLGKLFEVTGDDKPKGSPERKKKIVKDDREIRLGNIVFKPSKGDWQCKERGCLNWNYAKRERCNKCGQYKEGSKAPRQERKVTRKFWPCPECNFQNFEYKERCYKCGLKKGEGRPTE